MERQICPYCTYGINEQPLITTNRLQRRNRRGLFGFHTIISVVTITTGYNDRNHRSFGCRYNRFLLYVYNCYNF